MVLINFKTRFQIWGNSSMKGQKLSIDDTSNRESVETVDDQIINFLVEFLKTLLSEIVVGSHLPALVISPEKENVVREINFQSVEHQNDLDSVNSSINIIPQKQILRGLGISPTSENFPHVVKLSVNVSDQRDWILQIEQIWFGLEK